MTKEMTKEKSAVPAAAKSAKSAPAAAKNTSNIYRLRRNGREVGWYLNWQALGEVYREAFMDSTYGGEQKALARARAVAKAFNDNRERIERDLKELWPEVEAERAQRAAAREDRRLRRTVRALAEGR
jgi:hypothetical protein